MGKSTKAGPPWGASAAANASSTRPGISAVLSGVTASFVSGRTRGAWSSSSGEPCPQRIAGALPPSTTIGEWLACAEAMALIPLVPPAPAVSPHTPSSQLPLGRAHGAHPVGHTRTGRQRTHARLAGHLGPALRRERSRGLVAHVHDLDALLAATVVDREQVPPREREELAHAVGLQAACHQSSAMEGPGVLGALSGHGRDSIHSPARRARPDSEVPGVGFEPTGPSGHRF